MLVAAPRATLLFSSKMSNTYGPSNRKEDILSPLPKACAGRAVMTTDATWAITTNEHCQLRTSGYDSMPRLQMVCEELFGILPASWWLNVVILVKA